MGHESLLTVWSLNTLTVLGGSYLSAKPTSGTRSRRAAADVGAWSLIWSLIWSLMDPVSCVSCVSWMYSVYAAETHETFHWESGMRYHPFTKAPIRAQIEPISA